MSVVDQDREERRTLRRDQPARDTSSWWQYGHRVILAVSVTPDDEDPEDWASDVRSHALALIRGAIDGGHMTDAQLGELARGIIAGLRDAGLAPEAVEA